VSDGKQRERARGPSPLLSPQLVKNIFYRSIKMKKTNLVLGIMLIIVFSGSLYAQGNCLDFDGTDDYVDCGNGGSLNITGTISIEAWIYPTDFKDVSWKNTIVANDNWSGTNSEGYVFRYGGSNGDLDFTFAYAGGYNWASTTAAGVLTLNTWQHVAVSYNNIAVVLYVDGEEEFSQNYSYPIISSVKNANIGRSTGDVPGRCLVGQIEDLRIWNTVRTQTEIQDNMNNELTGSESGLVAYYKFNEGSGQTASDSAGDNEGMLGSTSGSDSADPSWIISDAPLPVNLSSFYALYTGGNPILYWTTQTEENDAYWNVNRGTTDNLTTAVNINANNPIPGNGTTISATDYIYIDEVPVVQNANYWYWIEDVSTDGETTLHDPITLSIPFEDTPVTPENYGLQQNYPNPFNPSTSISFALAEDSNVELIIYNVKGEKVKTIFNDHVYADQITSIVWNGKDTDGKQVSSGVYFYKLKAGTREYNKKMLMVK